MNELDTIKQAANIITESQRKAGYGSTGMYLYTDIEGNILYVRLRMDKPDGSKWIRPFSRDDAGNWTQLKEPTFAGGKPLYNLQAIAREPDKPVFIVEGEKCANALNRLGLIATTSGGATSAKDANWQSLAGREVILWPDNDTAGEQYASDVEKMLKPLNCNVSTIDISALNLPAKGDCVDWLEWFDSFHGHNATKADVLALPRIADAQQARVSDLIPAGDTVTLADNYAVTVNLQCAADITPEAMSWLWHGWLAKGKLHIFAGQAGTGKTTIAIALAATITTGGRFPDGSRSPKGSVLIWSGEDSPADTLVPRLMAAGADLTKVHFVGDTTDNYELRAFDPATDMTPLMLKAALIPDLALLIIDPIVNAVAGDSHKNGEVRRALQPVVDFGEKLNCAVLGITHFSKGGQGKDPLERVTGSLAFGALARIVLATAKIDDGDKTKRIVCRAKSNIGIDSGGFEYDLQEKEVQAGIFSSYALWGDAIEGSARELLAEPDNREQGENGKSALDDAKDFLRELLADGELPQKQIQTDAKGASHSWATVRRAKTELNIISSKSKLDNCWYWKLPINMLTRDEHAQGVHINNVSMLSILPEIEQVIDDVMEF
jgi:5S rRNA maturation endonuclease (ribonuclease M5)